MSKYRIQQHIVLSSDPYRTTRPGAKLTSIWYWKNMWSNRVSDIGVNREKRSKPRKKGENREKRCKLTRLSQNLRGLDFQSIFRFWKNHDWHLNEQKYFWAHRKTEHFKTFKIFGSTLICCSSLLMKNVLFFTVDDSYINEMMVVGGTIMFIRNDRWDWRIGWGWRTGFAVVLWAVVVKVLDGGYFRIWMIK